ncbi:MAG: DEAD/DEAH box helicase, partial [Myxococcales bacterium]|nr:DEAD/DEAH box helicase [Myxococcales bacterium]
MRPGGFDGLGLDRALLRGIDAAGYDQPRPIQVETIPAACAGRDVLGLAQTGTGKTAAFALPLLERLLDAPRGERARGPRALILAPTRELATQIDAELRQLARFTRIRSVTVFGGTSARSQIAALRRHPEVVVACPGRLLDLYGQRAVRFDDVETLVLDEADHMFDMGFLPDIKRILRALPEQRQNLLFSATMPAAIRKLADDLLDRAHVVELAHSTPAGTIEHALYTVSESRKEALLQEMLADSATASAIVFTRTKHRAKRLAQKLDRSGHRAIALQGNMSQGQRDRAMRGFRERKFDVLVATDIAARGIDVSKVSHVINFDVPITPDAYTHRIGRTGRSENQGKACTFVTREDRAMVRAIERTIGEPIPRRQIEGFTEELGSEGRSDRGGERNAKSRSGGGRGRNTRRGNGRGSGEARRSEGARPG